LQTTLQTYSSSGSFEALKKIKNPLTPQKKWWLLEVAKRHALHGLFQKKAASGPFRALPGIPRFGCVCGRRLPGAAA
jgi:hypothetical protein